MTGAGRDPAGRLLLSLLFALTACAPQEEERILAAQRVHSWAASVDLSTQALGRGTVPRVYARQVLRAARDARDREAGKPGWGAIAPGVRRELEDAIRRLNAAVGDLPVASP